MLRKSDKELLKSCVDVAVGQRGIPGMESQGVAEVRSRDIAALEVGENSRLDIFAEKAVGVGHTELFESLHTAVSVDIDYDSAEVEQQILYHPRKFMRGLLSDDFPSALSAWRMVPTALRTRSTIFLSRVAVGYFSRMSMTSSSSNWSGLSTI